VSTDGEPYKDLANAGKYRTSYTPGCTCKPPNQSWVQALQKAEELLDNKSKRDLIVTVEKSKELSKAKKVKESKRRRSKREIEDEKEAERERLELEQAGKRAALEVQNNQAGIAPGRESRRSVYSLHDGEKKDVRTANGETRTVRIIAPKL
jgi:type II secretory pathway component HofQ